MCNFVKGVFNISNQNKLSVDVLQKTHIFGCVFKATKSGKRLSVSIGKYTIAVFEYSIVYDTKYYCAVVSYVI